VKKFGRTISRIENRIIYVGHIIPSKGITELVTACRHVNGIELHLIGTVTQEYLHQLEDIAKSKDDGSWLKYRGKMPHEEVIAEMMAAGTFCLPSYTEGFPNVILESMACGCSIIATPVGAIPEMLQLDEHEKCGLKVNIKDAESIKSQLNVILSDSELRAQCRKNAIERVNELYAVPIIWNQLESIWKS
jgi:glycosyltransferase involved in cell wall biosynthesis